MSLSDAAEAAISCVEAEVCWCRTCSVEALESCATADLADALFHRRVGGDPVGDADTAPSPLHAERTAAGASMLRSPIRQARSVAGAIASGQWVRAADSVTLQRWW